MKFSFRVGEREPHTVEYSWSQFWGRMSVRVDGEKVFGKTQLLMLKFNDPVEFDVGTTELHRVRIEKHCFLFFANFLWRDYLVYVDGELVKKFTGY